MEWRGRRAVAEQLAVLGQVDILGIRADDRPPRRLAAPMQAILSSLKWQSLTVAECRSEGSFVIYRFAYKIPLLYDEASDVSYRVISAMNWRRYKVAPDMPIAIVIHICSTKVPYKTVGKEFIADCPEVRREEANAIREVARTTAAFPFTSRTRSYGEEEAWDLWQETGVKSPSSPRR